MSKKFNVSIMLKAVVIGVLILIMLIPLIFVKGAITDRTQYRDEAVSKITESWGGNLVIAAPILNIPYIVNTTEKVNNAEKTVTKTFYAKLTPKDLNISVEMDAQTRYIGIFETPVYTAHISMKGSFDKAAGFSDSGLQDAFITIEINELKGISVPEFQWNGIKKDFAPAYLGAPISVDSINNDYHNFIGTRSKFAAERSNKVYVLKALNSPVNLKNTGNGTFEISFDIKGSGTLSFVPLARNNQISIRSNWANPSFSGKFLPDEKTIAKNGFEAKWNINYLASGIPERIDTIKNGLVSFNTSLIIPIDNYRKAERASKYGILFIILTFVLCFIFEIAYKKSIHPVQYLLVGFAMAIFYILLVSISEFLPFTLAYSIAAIATIALITIYAKLAIAKDIKLKQMGIVALSLSFLYGYLFIILQLQDMALLYGSIGLFIALAVIMYMTRNIAWYEEQ
ncbi:MAG: cell envelope integrity protein CreD [Elusimicrobiota bacterium]|jgi:inner membrane protein|nr:cell envelope integrity protein CreD [Elusimicrobiota bacterium]